MMLGLLSVSTQWLKLVLVTEAPQLETLAALPVIHWVTQYWPTPTIWKSSLPASAPLTSRNPRLPPRKT